MGLFQWKLWAFPLIVNHITISVNRISIHRVQENIGSTLLCMWNCRPYRWSMVLLQAFVTKQEETTAVRITPAWHSCTTTCGVWCAVPLQVELLVMKALSVGLIKGNIDEVDQKVQMTWVQPRVLDVHQVKWCTHTFSERGSCSPAVVAFFRCWKITQVIVKIYIAFSNSQYRDFTTLAL